MSHFTKTIHSHSYDDISPSLPALSQSGRTVLITGGGTGIGFSIARAFIAGSAARVFIASRSEFQLIQAKTQLEELVQQASTVIETAILDLASTASINSVWSSLKERNIEVNVLVLNAGDFATSVNIAESGAFEGLRRAYDINVLGNWQMTTNFIAQGPRHGKSLVNVSSAHAHLIPDTRPAYGSTKAAFVHLLQGLAEEVSREDVQCISLHPGAIFTENAKTLGYTADSIPWDHEDLPAHFVVWAASKEAAFLHGRFVWAKWDVSELKNMEQRIVKNVEFLKIGLKGTAPLVQE